MSIIRQSNRIKTQVDYLVLSGGRSRDSRITNVKQYTDKQSDMSDSNDKVKATSPSSSIVNVGIDDLTMTMNVGEWPHFKLS